MAPNRSKAHYNSDIENGAPTKVFHSRELHQDEIEDLKAAFKIFDTDGDGEISSDELSEILRIFGTSSQISDVYLQELIEEIDIDKNGKIEFNDFLELMRSCSYFTSEDNDLKYAFDKIDSDENGFVTMKELKDLLRKTNYFLKDVEIDAIIEQVDEDGDGRLNFGEFKRMVSFSPGDKPEPPVAKIPRKISNLALAQEIKATAEKERSRWTPCISRTTKFYLMAVGMPMLFALLYAIAILFPPDARAKVPILLWTDGELKFEDGKATLCPTNRPYICSEGITQIILIAIARVSAFASYVMVGFVFVSKMHSTIHFLSSTIFSQTAPIENMHRLHSIMGRIYGVLALVHTVTHIVRWGMRGELALLVLSRPGLSGVFGILSMAVTVLSMTLAKRFKGKISYDARFTAHWSFTVLVLAMAFHTPRCRTITSIFFFLWAADYLYTYLFKTHRLDIVEFTSLPGGNGCQLLWRNPENFKVKSGQYVKIQVPWLTEGGNEWHPFSVYLNEATEEGLRSSGSSFESKLESMEEGLLEMQDETLNEDVFVRRFLDQEYQSRGDEYDDLVCMEAREEMRHTTTQIFVAPVGDWSTRLNQQVLRRTHLSSCWVRGPYTSPYHVGNSFCHLVLTATGIGITPSLAVGAQFPGHTRTKILIWSCKCAKMLKFFAPLFVDFHMIMIYYTGEEKLSVEDARRIRSAGNGNIFLKTSRGDFLNAISVVVSAYESEMSSSSSPIKSIEQVPKEALKTWCFMYCGGSKRICDDMESFSKDHGVSFRSERFDW